MLFYSFRNDSGQIEAIYTGRFAFAHVEHEKLSQLEELEKLRRGNDLKQLWCNSNKGNKLIRLAAHEYTHKHIFGHSYSGLVLNGWRFWVRILYHGLGMQESLKAYYMARAVYFYKTYDYHEQIAEALDHELKVSPEHSGTLFEKALNSREYTELISNVEDEVLRIWYKHQVDVSPPVSWLYWLTGKIFQYGFSIRVAYTDSNGHRMSKPIADRGLVNDAEILHEEKSYLKRLIKWVLKRGAIDPLARIENFDNYVEWFWYSQRAQFQIIHDEFGVSLPDFKVRYMRPMADFIFDFEAIPAIYQAKLASLFSDAFTMHHKEFMNRWGDYIQSNQEDSSFRRFFTYFHSHGN